MFGRRSRSVPSAEAVRAGIRDAIVRLDEQRRLAASAAGRALVNQAEVRRACDEQLATLAAAASEAEEAEAAARRAAQDARRDADPDLAAFEQTAAGLADIRQALTAAAAPLHQLREAARRNVDEAGEVLIGAHATLDEQIRAQIRLLRAWEEAEQRRIVRQLRAARRR